MEFSSIRRLTQKRLGTYLIFKDATFKEKGELHILDRSTFSGLTVLTILLIGVLALSLNIQPAKGWTGTAYIRADGSIEPADAPIITYDNVTYTLTDNITSDADGIVVERNNIVIDGEEHIVSGSNIGAGLKLINVNNVTIKNTNIENFGNGIYLNGSSNIYLVRNNVVNNPHGIVPWYSSNISIVGNNITANSGHGIVLTYSSNYDITANDIANNGNGIRLIDSYNGNIVGNNVTNNGDGISLEISSNNRILSNIVVNNRYGIGLTGSNNWIAGNIITNNRYGISIATGVRFSNNTISENIVKANNEGIYILYSLSNKIYHNNFIDNSVQVRFSSSALNIWDNGYPSGGNYWSDYNGTDLYSGVYQNETGSDGIGDTPYVIDENNIDHYPLMTPYAITPPVPSVINATVDINPKALNLRSRGKWITAYIELPEGYNIQDINASTIMLNDTVSAELKPITIGDHDEDGTLDLMVKFDRATVISYILANVNKTELFEERFMRVALTITGYLKDGTLFQGTTTIRVLMPIPFFVSKIWRFCRTLQVFPI